MLDYNVPGGKLNRGMAVYDVLASLKEGEVRVCGWQLQPALASRCPLQTSPAAATAQTQQQGPLWRRRGRWQFRVVCPVSTKQQLTERTGRSGEVQFNRDSVQKQGRFYNLRCQYSRLLFVCRTCRSRRSSRQMLWDGALSG